MKVLFYILILGLLSCSNKHPGERADEKTLEDTSECLVKPFGKQAGEYVVQAIYNDCEPDWKYQLKILKNNQVAFTADSLMEFEFNNHTWPDYLNVSDDSVQILLEVNDRPLINYILCLMLVNGHVVRKERFPLFSEPKDFDHDGRVEYSGYSYTSEGYTDDSCYYNPIIFVGKENNKFYLDSILTVAVNTRLYGAFYGWEAAEMKLKNPSPDTVKKYLNKP